jgi:hypothetical protein
LAKPGTLGISQLSSSTLERKFSNIIHEELPTSKQAAHIESVNYTYYTPRISQEKKNYYT